ncbi:Alg9-like mannosyltransferase family-domain-containing protein [Fimicolochytrium jonesii]|uniref:Alg9-like mannosyltransferase family-domain-containing protein n=1 Tax=Fimicolochytrium jonesii TaxID=1396493 RepID=UPI0022FF1023|nr:Alg9-like mannosyltransferase family-domain-containing protein [Fimicolochytrium jonesii]KAI8818586.1 Alg9-like mannosyltransferase family-domain-containing protein [Fimicolochytrium jonesii]
MSASASIFEADQTLRRRRPSGDESAGATTSSLRSIRSNTTPRTRVSRRARPAQAGPIISIWDVATIGLLFFYLYLAPYTKVEESFNLQAAYDLIEHGPQNPQIFDNLAYPGVVPRTFVGPLVIYCLTYPLKLLSMPLFTWQYIVRGVLGLAVGISLARIRRAVHNDFGPVAANWYGAFTAAQFHLTFWGTRTLPNTFAFVLVNSAFALWIGSPRTMPTDIEEESFGEPYALKMTALLVFTSAVFRCDVALLTAAILIGEFTRTPFVPVIKHAMKTGQFSVLITTVVDSWFWQQVTWPELSVFQFNTVKNGSEAYGVMPYHAYFSRLLPKMSPLGIPLVTYAFGVEPRTRRYTVPVAAFVALYSFLPHKEWRFIIYALPIMNAMAGVAVAHISRPSADWRKTRRSAVLALKFYVLAHFAASFFMAYVSSFNYPGGEALARANHDIYPYPTAASESLSEADRPYVHLDAPTAISGASLFGQDRRIRYSKNETYSTPEEYFKEGFTHLITADPHFHLGLRDELNQEAWTPVEVIYGYAGLERYPGGLTAWAKDVIHRAGDVLRQDKLTRAALMILDDDPIVAQPKTRPLSVWDVPVIPVMIRLEPKLWILESIRYPVFP